MRHLTFVILAVALAGCVTTGVENVQELPIGHRILVVSALGDGMTIQHTGTTIAGNWQSTEKVSDWKIDDQVEGLIVGKLSESGRFEIVTTDTQNIRNRLGPVGTDYISANRVMEGGLETLLAAGRQAGADSILLVGTVELQDIFFSTNQLVKGYGIYQRTAFGMKRGIEFALVDLWLIDVASGRDTAETYHFDQRPRHKSDWVEQEQVLAGDNRQGTRTSVIELLSALVEHSLRELTLISE